MIKKFREHAYKFLLEILIFVITATASCLVSLKVTAAEHEVEIKNIESTLESLRDENSSAHKQILDVLLKR